MMVSVTKRIKQVKQPRGGYLKPSEMQKIDLPTQSIMTYTENLSPAIIGTAVDYLTRFMMSGQALQAFKISYIGASQMNDSEQAKQWIEEIRGLDDLSITRACQLVNYDSVFRAGFIPKDFKEPDASTIMSIKMLVKRSLQFFDKVGHVTADGFTFDRAYTSIINAGDGDFLTEDTLWDFKVSKYPPNKDHTLQLMIYYLMGKESKQKIFDNIRYVAIFNPRLNSIYRYDMTQMSQATIHEIRQTVIGYDD